jgi:O-antigen ligase
MLPATMLVFAVILGLAGYLGWPQIKKRFDKEGDSLSGRRQIYTNTRRVVADFPWLGTGPGSFVAVYGLYRADPAEQWDAYGHNDWLQTRMEWGAVGFGLILAALGVLFLKTAAARRPSAPWLLGAVCWLALGGCLAHGLYDFPLQVYSVLFLFLLEAAILFAHGGKLFQPGR